MEQESQISLFRPLSTNPSSVLRRPSGRAQCERTVLVRNVGDRASKLLCRTTEPFRQRPKRAVPCRSVPIQRRAAEQEAMHDHGTFPFFTLT